MENKPSSPQVVDSALRLPGEFPSVPNEVLERFPSMGTWMDSVNQFFSANSNALNDFARAVLDVTEIAGVLTVDGAAGSLYVRRVRGVGKYNDADTPFYVDVNGFFSLGTSVTWNPDEDDLTVQGTIIATAGEIGGWIISTTTLSKNNAVLDSAGQLALGTGNDIAILSATDPTYRLWIGNAAAGTASFSVTKAGVLFATGAVISGSITATSGTIGGFSIGTDYIRDAANSMGLASTVTGGDDTRFWAGATFANRATAPFRVTESGAITATLAVIGGTGSAGDYVGISSAGLQVGANTAQAVFYVNNNAGNARVNMRYNGNIVLTANAIDLGAGVSHGVIQLSRSNGTGSNILNGDSIVIISTTSNDLLSLAGTGGSMIFDAAGLLTVSNDLTVGDDLTVGGAALFNGGWVAIGSCVITSGGLAVDNASSFGASLTVGTTLRTGDGSTSAPSHSFTNDTDTGHFLDGTGKVATVTSGTTRFTVSDTRVAALVDFKVNNVRAAGAPVAGGTITMRDSGDNVVQVLVV